MLLLPESLERTDKLADWLELSTLIAKDKNSSAGDLAAALRLASIFRDEHILESKILEVFDELEHRFQAAGNAYPFEINGNVISFQSGWKKFRPYVFCLCLSYFGFSNKKPRTYYPERLFEELACDAARNYLNGNAVKFGWPRRHPLPHSFSKAIESLCNEHMKEGQGFRQQPSPQQNGDGRVDIVAWRDFPDAHPGKLLMFGACAVGNDWEDKRLELRPNEFCANWMSEIPPSPLIKAFFVPHRVKHPEWDRYTREAGILFDRCRISFWTTGHPSVSFDTGSADAWLNNVLRTVS